MEAVIEKIEFPGAVWAPTKERNMPEYSSKVGEFAVEHVTLMAPSSYDDMAKKNSPLYAAIVGGGRSCKRSIGLHVQRTGPSFSRETRFHVIFLSGGPGTLGRTYDGAMQSLMHSFIASKSLFASLTGSSADGTHSDLTTTSINCYAMDHRGVGRSGAFVPDGQDAPWDDAAALRRVIEGGPFDVGDLTLRNAALDVGLLASYIRKSHAPTVGGVPIHVAVYGYSYGAQLAHHAVQLLPHTFNTAFLLAIPEVRPVRYTTAVTAASLFSTPPAEGATVEKGNAIPFVCPSMDGILDSCMMNAFCRSHFADDVRQAYQNALQRITADEEEAAPNACTVQFYKAWPDHFGTSQGPARRAGERQPASAMPSGGRTFSFFSTRQQRSNGQRERLRNIASLLGPLARSPDGLASHGGEDVLASQVVIAAIKATADCRDAGSYKEKVLYPLVDLVNRFNRSLGGSVAKSSAKGDGEAAGGGAAVLAVAAGKRQVMNDFVNTIVTLNKDYDFEQHSSGISEAVREYENLCGLGDLAGPTMYMPTYYDRWLRVREYLRAAGWKHTTMGAIRSSLTHVHVAAARMDVVTTAEPAFAIYQSVVAPRRSWLLFEERDHDGLASPCKDAWMVAALRRTPLASASSCLAKENSVSKIDWSFARHPKYARIWDLIAERSPADLALGGDFGSRASRLAAISPIPTFHMENDADVEKHIKYLEELPRDTLIALYGAGVFFLALIVMFFVFLLLTRRVKCYHCRQCERRRPIVHPPAAIFTVGDFSVGGGGGDICAHANEWRDGRASADSHHKHVSA